MGWADQHVAKLKAGETVSFRPHGNSMQPKINNGQLCTVIPIEDEISPGEIVLCKVRGRQFLHLVKAVRGNQFQIGNNKGRINGWVSRNAIFGRCVKVE